MKKLLALTLGVALAGVGTVAMAARNASGTHTLPLSNPVVAGTKITAAWANALTADLSAEITDSLSRSGKGGMTAALRGVDGSAAAPALSFTGETSSGWYRQAAGNVRLAVTGTDSLQCTASGVTVPGALAITGAVTLNAGAAQSVTKSGGVLTVGTSDANAMALSTNGVTRFTIETSGAMTSVGGTITGLPTPSAASDAATKGYVDAATSFALVAGDQTDAAGVFTNASGLGFPVEASKVYEYEFVIVDETAAVTTGVWYGLTGPVLGVGGSNTFTNYWIDTNTSSVPLSAAATTGFNSIAAATGHASGRSVARIDGVLANGPNAGTVQLQFRTEVAGSAATVRAGSFVRYRKLN